MKQVLFVISLSFGMSSLIFVFSPSRVMAQGSASDVRRDKNKPTVFLSFERFGVYQSPCGEAKDPGIWLRLRNNSSWAIFVTGFPVSENGSNSADFKLSDEISVKGVKDSTEMRLRYDFEGVSITATKVDVGRVQLGVPIDVQLPQTSKFCSEKWMTGEVGRNRGSWIPPGSSILFSVPKDGFSTKLRVSIQFNYEWESTEGNVRDFEPHHLAYFYGIDLPSNSNPE